MAKILILEDEILLASYWQKLLESDGHQVVCCSTVSQALKQLSAMFFDLIIADMMIKEQGKFVNSGGLTLIGKRLMCNFPMIPIIGVSGYKPTFSNSALEIAKDMGVDLAIYKPISPDTLLNAVNKLLNRGQDSD
ncbi:response regulator [Dapis sp. BLCC M126]|uniref:response regulator n=1 Tax=Dapis sp. BLCC M126 TaxID=3400189 RepID=UPI003CEA1AD2